ncbi:MAG TPA: histidine phosphatase family protein [Mycobacterium sp.]|jgi:phosphohistidine phosphatase SixA|nr:histidine phosphatase family protein [Mycobacterium sp.]
MFVVVRHAHAGRKADWDGPDAQRPLSEKGRRQALGLVASLRGLDLRAVWSSPTARCRQTVAPLADERQLPIRGLELLLPDAEVTALSALLASPNMDGAVLCTHRKTLARLLPLWRHTAVPDDPGGGGTAKGAAWLVGDLAGAHPRLRYVPATPL